MDLPGKGLIVSLYASERNEAYAKKEYNADCIASYLYIASFLPAAICIASHIMLYM